MTPVGFGLGFGLAFVGTGGGGIAPERAAVGVTADGVEGRAALGMILSLGGAGVAGTAWGR